MSDLVPVHRALISVSDKTGLADFARALHVEFGVELVSTGGTARFLRDLGLPVMDVADLTGFPEMMGGRVKTLHPKVHGGLLALREDPEHVAAMREHDIQPIDLVCINLYPFAQTIAKPGVTFEEAIENIDIGGPSMIRSASKNHRWVLVVTSPDRYEKVLGDMREHKGATCGKHRLKQAQRAFAHTAAYDGVIAEYLAGVIGTASGPLAPVLRGEGGGEGLAGGGLRTEDSGLSKNAATPSGLNPKSSVLSPLSDPSPQPSPLSTGARGPEPVLPDQISLTLQKTQNLRYGENPHQKGALYVAGKPAEASVAFATQLHGKELSYINLLDADGALSAVKELSTPTACIVKHATPCGFATADDLPTAFRKAFDGDPLAAFGGIVALNQAVDLATAQAITSIDKLLEVIVAPSFVEDALQLLRDRWKNVRLLAVGPIGAPDPREWQMHKIVGGFLIQERDLTGITETELKVVTHRMPTDAEWGDLKVAWLACKHVKSNAIVLAKGSGVVGVGGGQVDRVGAAKIAIAKAGERAKGAVAASDAFFPFPDGPQALLDAGVTAIIHPGGSVRDQESVDLANARGAAMVVTGQRHFRH